MAKPKTFLVDNVYCIHRCNGDIEQMAPTHGQAIISNLISLNSIDFMDGDTVWE